MSKYRQIKVQQMISLYKPTKSKGINNFSHNKKLLPIPQSSSINKKPSSSRIRSRDLVVPFDLQNLVSQPNQRYKNRFKIDNHYQAKPSSLDILKRKSKYNGVCKDCEKNKEQSQGWRNACIDLEKKIHQLKEDKKQNQIKMQQILKAIQNKDLMMNLSTTLYESIKNIANSFSKILEPEMFVIPQICQVIQSYYLKITSQIMQSCKSFDIQRIRNINKKIKTKKPSLLANRHIKDNNEKQDNTQESSLRLKIQKYQQIIDILSGNLQQSEEYIEKLEGEREQLIEYIEQNMTG